MDLEYIPEDDHVSGYMLRESLGEHLQSNVPHNIEEK